MGFTLQDFENKAAEKYKGLTVNDDDGAALFTLRSNIRLSDAESRKLQDAQEALTAYQKDEVDAEGNKTPKDVKTSDMRRLIGNVLVALSDSAQRAKTFLAPLDLAVHMAILEQYREETQAAEGN